MSIEAKATGTKLLDEYMTPDELCAELGIATRTLPRWHAMGAAPPKTKIGRQVLYRRASVAAWIAAQEGKT